MNHTQAATLAALVVVAATATGCGGSGGPAPTPENTEPVQISYHPCDELPRDVLEQLGFTPDSDRTDRETPVMARECTFAHRDPGYGSTFAARGMSFQSVIDDDRLVPVRRGTIDGRDVYYADFAKACFATVNFDPAVFQLTVGFNPNSIVPDEEITNATAACDEAERVLTALSPYLPDQL